MIFLGIDPGALGALAIIDEAGDVKVFDTPSFKVTVGKTQRNRIDVAALYVLLREQVPMNGPVFAAIERIQPQPGFSASTMFWLGYSVGIWEAALAALLIPYQPVRSHDWKKMFGIAKETRTKGQARALALKLFPKLAPELARVRDDGRAEAALIATFAKRTQAGASQAATAAG